MKFKFFLNTPFDLQKFADDTGNGQGQDGQNDTTPGHPDDNPQGNQNNNPQPKYTDEDVNKIINARFAKWEKERQKKEQDANEAARLKNLSDEEKRNEQIKSMRQELDNLKKEKALSEMAKTARGLLTEKNINVSDSLISNLISTDAEKTKEAVDSFAKAFEEAVKKAVAEKLKGKAPMAGSQGKTITKEEIFKIANPRERQEAIQKNLDLFR